MQELEAQALEAGLPMPPLPGNPFKGQDDATEESTQKDQTILTLNPDHLVLAME